jgi:hypothetical protein
MSSTTIGIIKLCLTGMVIVGAFANTYQASKGHSVFAAIPRFLGVVISTIPFIDLIQWLVFKSGSPQYSRACGTQALLGAAWYVVGKTILEHGA